jgi:hypothetical protein
VEVEGAARVVSTAEEAGPMTTTGAQMVGCCAGGLLRWRGAEPVEERVRPQAQEQAATVMLGDRAVTAGKEGRTGVGGETSSHYKKLTIFDARKFFDSFCEPPKIGPYFWRPIYDRRKLEEKPSKVRAAKNCPTFGGFILLGR